MIATELPSTSSEISRALRDIYPHVGRFERLLLRWRPYICPFHKILARVPPDSCTVLDVGCGIGIVSCLLAIFGQQSRFRRIVAFDVSKDAIRTAKQAKLRLGNSVDFQTVEKTSPWPEGPFDTVLCIDVIHHVRADEQNGFVARLTSCCHEGSTLIIKDISPTPWWKAIMNFLHDLFLSRQLVHHRKEQEIASWLEQLGMRVIENSRQDQLWYSHYLIVARNKSS